MRCNPTGKLVVFRLLGPSSRSLRRSLKLLLGLLAFAWIGAFGVEARAVVNGHIDVMNTNVDPDNYTPPVTTPGQPVVPDWLAGDPGWDNVTTSGSNFVYLGDNWVLTARHVAAATATFSTGSFPRISSQNYIIRNPPASLAGGASLTTETDLRLFRISGNVGLPALPIATESPPLIAADESNQQVTQNSRVMFIGQGRIRFSTESHWALNLSSPPANWATAEVTSGGNVHGYETSTTRAKRWGANRLENPGSSQYEPEIFDEVLSSTTAVMPLETADGITRDVISMVTKFEQQPTNPQQQATTSILPFESQAVSNDSGGAVFYNRGTDAVPDWVLAGIVNATIIYGNQPRSYAVYGNSTTFADLSYYNQPYKLSICDVMKTCGSYSILGDVNIDGNVTGDGTGATSVDDVSAFIAGWGNDNLAGSGDYETWTRGDLNLDGVTDVDDFLMLRGALNGPINNSVMVSLFGAVPEPSSAVLALLAAAFFAAIARRRAGR